VVNFVVEIPKGTNAKIEIDVTDAPHHPLKQDIKKEKLRFVADVNGHKGYPWNYGAIPQTWEDPSVPYPPTGTYGDRDPLDIVDITSTTHNRGDIVQAKVLGVYLLIDEGETDWKIIAIDVRDPEASKIDSLEDVEKLRPGYLKDLHDWFRDYKIPDGKPPNNFAFEGKGKDRAFALEVVEEGHRQWLTRFNK